MSSCSIFSLTRDVEEWGVIHTCANGASCFLGNQKGMRLIIILPIDHILLMHIAWVLVSSAEGAICSLLTQTGRATLGCPLHQSFQFRKTEASIFLLQLRLNSWSRSLLQFRAAVCRGRESVPSRSVQRRLNIEELSHPAWLYVLCLESQKEKLVYS